MNNNLETHGDVQGQKRKWVVAIIALIIAALVITVLFLLFNKNNENNLESTSVLDDAAIYPFEYLDVSYEGADPYAEIVLENNSTDSIYEKIYFSADKTEKVANNDEITITATLSPDYDVTFSRSEKTITVDDLGSYLLTADDLSQDQLDALKEKALEHIDELFQSNKYENIFTYLKSSRVDMYEITAVYNTDPVYNS